MQLIPVLDVMGGVVVRGVAGRRSEYRPIVSSLCRSAEPAAVVRAFQDQFNLYDFYLADLDAIAGAPPARTIYRQLHDQGARLWVDAGIRSLAGALDLASTDIAQVILALETVPGPDEVRDICTHLGPERLIFSLDLQSGRPLTDSHTWGAASAQTIAQTVIQSGIRKLLLLDLCSVGVGQGPGTDALTLVLRQRHPEVSLITGGGIRGSGDLFHQARLGVSAVLVASALHDGRLTREEVVRWAPGGRTNSLASW